MNLITLENKIAKPKLVLVNNVRKLVCKHDLCFFMICEFAGKAQYVNMIQQKCCSHGWACCKKTAEVEADNTLLRQGTVHAHASY